MGNEGGGERLRSGSLLALRAAVLGLEEEVGDFGRWVGVGGRTVEVVNEDEWTLDVVGGDVALLKAVEEEDEWTLDVMGGGAGLLEAVEEEDRVLDVEEDD